MRRMSHLLRLGPPVRHNARWLRAATRWPALWRHPQAPQFWRAWAWATGGGVGHMGLEPAWVTLRRRASASKVSRHWMGGIRWALPLDALWRSSSMLLLARMPWRVALT